MTKAAPASGQVTGLFADATGGDADLADRQAGPLRLDLVVVPLRDCAAGAGRVWVAHERAKIRSSPVVDPTRPLLREHELTICAHYGVGEGVGRAAEVAGRRRGRRLLSASPPEPFRRSLSS